MNKENMELLNKKGCHPRGLLAGIQKEMVILPIIGTTDILSLSAPVFIQRRNPGLKNLPGQAKNPGRVKPVFMVLLWQYVSQPFIGYSLRPPR